LLRLVDRFLDSFQNVEESLTWVSEFNGAMVPVAPCKDVALRVKSGKIPDDLSGVYTRVGPNAFYFPPKKRMHVFDGDGMVHSVRIADGKAVYHRDFLDTPRLQFEKKYGAEWFTRIGEFSGWSGLAKVLLVAGKKNYLAGLAENEGSTANTAIGLTPEGKLWALGEGGPPFRFRLDEQGRPVSVGYDTLGGTLQENMSAHPKMDNQTGEIFFHGRVLGKKRFYASRVEGGLMTDQAMLSVPDGFHHDMFITENYVVIIDGSMKFGPEAIVKQKPLWEFAPERKLRFGIWPRSEKRMTPESFQWIEAPEAAEIVHTMFGYDEDGKIILWTPLGRHDEGVETGVLGGIGAFRMHRVVIDVAKGSVEIQAVPGSHLKTEFPRVRDDRIGRRARYGYSGLQGPGEFDFVGVLKWDFEECRLISELRFPPGIIGGEPVFVPAGEGEGEDEGYIAMFLWNIKTRESTFALFDARTLASEPVVELEVPDHDVPLGFHALWITEEQFQKQLALS